MGNVNGGFLCHECKYCHYDVFGRALCLAKDNLVINGYDKACDDDFDSRYEVSEENKMVLMKKIIILALTALMTVGCMKKKDNGEPIISDYYRQHSVDNPYMQVLDSCEYICWHSSMAHKGNCRFCKERRQKELEELVIKLKEK